MNKATIPAIMMTAAGLFLWVSHANAQFLNPAATSIAGAAAGAVADASSLNQQQLDSMQGTNTAVTTNNETDVDGSLGLAFSFPPPAIGNGPWGSYAAVWGLWTSTYYEEGIVNSNVFSNVLTAYSGQAKKDPFMTHILATYMCSSENDAIRAGGAVAYNTINAPVFGLPNLGGCPTPKN